MSTPEGFVDIDTIPQMLLKRVDVVTGGASAVYGSDAIVGVANFVTDTGFNGVKFNIQKGISTYGDGGTVDMGLAGGFKFFDDRAHILLGATWRKDDGIDSKFARPWGNDVRTLQGAGTAASPYFPMNGARQNNVTFGGKINSGVLADQQFLAGGTLGAFNHGSKSCAGGTIPTNLPYECGGDGGYYNGQIRATLDMKQFFARLDLDITDNLQFNQSISYVDKYSVGTVNWIANQSITINRDNAFLPASANPAQSPLNTINVPTVNGGNPNLKPEIGNTISLGAVFRPTSKLSLAIDYFDIKVKNFIYLVQGNSTEPQQVCYDSKGASPYCALVARGLGIYDANAANALSSANAVTTWYQLPINIAEQTTYGADIELNYRTSLNHQPLNLRVMATWQPHVRFKQAGVVDNDYAGAAFGSNGVQATPKWRVTAFLDYKVTDNLSISISERWRAKLHYHSSPAVVVAAPDTIKDVAYTNLGASLDVPMGRAKAQMFLNISNLFNVTPPVAGFWGNPNPGQFGEFVAGDDVIGRYFTFGIRGKF
ncbi:outer membrane receptor protein involved in Fe transport [Novosphingobium sp. SG751A]|nr:outer membrane receptor protein involved in Fe transport [Novosphingobium sp. SG751A]